MPAEISPLEISPPEISIVVPHLNQSDHLLAFLASLHAQDFDMDRAEVIVIDNGSRVLPREIVARFPGTVLAEEPVPGPGPARNRGAALSRAPILAFIDADCRVARDWAPAILARFAADPGLAIIGGDIRVFPTGSGRPGMAEAYESLYAFRQQFYIERQGFSVTANLATRRAVFDAVGPFGGINIAEDNDWCARAARLGYPTRFAPEVVVHHPARESLAEICTKWDRLITHHHAAVAPGFRGQAKWILKALALPVSPVAEIPRILRSDRLADRRARRLALQALALVRFHRARKMLAVMAARRGRPSDMRWNRG